jgi:hypothetical protein
MKKRFLIAFSALLIFALAIVAFAYTQNGATDQTASANCPMHEKMSASAMHDEKEKHSCGMADCCKDGHCKMGGDCCKDKDSCPMKNKEKQTDATDYSKITFSSDEGEDCCTGGGSCCTGGGACCKKEKSVS